MKARILALLAMVLGVVSCQTEPEGLDVNVGGEQEVAVCVSLPEATRSISAEGAFANVDLSGDATIRYILKIYQKVGDEYRASTDRQVEYSDGTNVVFPVRLVPNRDYRFVVWADYVDSKNAGDKHYNTTDLANITLNDTWVAMDETRDAFTGYFDTVDEGKQYTSTSSINITLTRPFAKLRVITTDMVELGYLGIVPHNAAVTYTTQFHESFNAFNGEYGAETVSKAHTSFTIKDYADFVGTDKKDTHKVLFTDYFFADDSDVVKFVMNVNEANGALIKSNTFNTDINVQRNYLTTIQGNILTDGNNVNVTVDPAFENGSTWNPNEDEYDYATISSEAELLAAINGQGGQGGEYVVTSDIDVTGLVASTQAATRTNGTTTTTPTTTTINLNGKTITVTNKTGEPFATVAAGNTLFLEGGNIVLTEDSNASFIKNEGNVVLTSGTFENESDHTEAAVVEGKVIVEENATFNDDNTSKVNKVEGATAWLADVLTNGGTYVFTEDLTSKEIIAVTATKAPVVLDGNGFTLTSTAGRAINVSGDKNVTIKNLNIVASGERAINIIQNAKNVTIENVTATAANYTVNVAGSAPGAIVAIKNSTLNGLCTVNVSSEGTQVTVDGSTVNCNDNNTTEGEAYAALSLNKDAVGGSIIATNSTINVTEGSDSAAGRNGAEDGVVTINGSVEGVKVMIAAITYPGSDYYHAFQTIAAAVEFAKSGDAISLIRNVELTEPLEIAEGKNVVLDLNGKTLTGTMAKSVGHVVMNEGTLTVKNGTISSTGANGGSALYNAGTLTVEDAIINGSSIRENGSWPSYPINNYGPVMTVKNSTINGYHGAVACNAAGTTTMEMCTINKEYLNTSSHVFYIDHAYAKVIVNGGTYTHKGTDGSLAYVNKGEITVNNGTFNAENGGYGMAPLSGGKVVVTGGTFNAGFLGWGGTITITGGTFKADPKNYLADGYKAVQSGGKYVVVADEVDTVVSKASDLDIAVAAGENVVMSGDITASAKDTTANSGYGATGIKVAKGATLDGNGNTLTINNAWGTWDCTIAATNGTIKNLTVNGAMRGIFMPGADGDVFIDNVIFKNVIYTFNSDAGNKNYGVYISNSTLNGWTSHSDVHKEVVYTNCSFGKGNGYAFCRPYGPTSFVGCNFCEGFEVEAIGKVTFENCTIGGVALTAENLSTLVVGGIANASVK